MSLTGGHLDALLDAGATAEQIVAIVKADMAEREMAVEGRRAKDAERQRRKRHAESRGVTRTRRDNSDPPKDIIKPPCSEAKASGGAAADPVKEVFDLGVSVLTSCGSSEKQARSLLGKWRKAKGEAAVLQALLDCRARSISNPVEWLTKRFQGGKWVSKSGYEYRGTDEQVMREAERRNDMDTYWRVKTAMRAAV